MTTDLQFVQTTSRSHVTVGPSRHDIAAVEDFVAACQRNDAEALWAAVVSLNQGSIDGWTLAMCRIADEVDKVSPAIQELFLVVWIAMTWLPLCVRDDATLSVALRVLLPPYDGPAVTLFRGTTVGEWETRAFGFSWTTALGTAIRFADEHERRGAPGCVLHTLASPDAVICASSAMIGASVEGENEFVIDPFRLGAVSRIQTASAPKNEGQRDAR